MQCYFLLCWGGNLTYGGGLKLTGGIYWQMIYRGFAMVTYEKDRCDRHDQGEGE